MRRPLQLASCLVPLALAACGNGAGGVAPLTLPFAVDDQYAASWYLGDGEAVGPLTDNGCTIRAGNHEGKCHSFSWVPVSSTSYAGVYWQYPDKSYGSLAGKLIPPGAKSISFWAWGGKGGEAVTFFAGVPIDGFSVTAGPITLTATPTQYYLNLQNVTYTNVAAAFGWDTNYQTSGGPTVINIDDIEWTTTPPVGTFPGCTDPKAANYNAGATMDDGSCKYSVTFQVDLTGNDPTGSEIPQIDATFNGYCNGCNALSKSSTGDIWTSTLPLAPGSYGFVYSRNAASPPAYEVVPTACSLNPSLPDNERTRSLTVTAAPQTLPVVKFGSCSDQ